MENKTETEVLKQIKDDIDQLIAEQGQTDNSWYSPHKLSEHAQLLLNYSLEIDNE